MKYRVETVQRTYNTYVVEADTAEEAEIKIIDLTNDQSDGDGITTIDLDEGTVEINSVMAVDE